MKDPIALQAAVAEPGQERVVPEGFKQVVAALSKLGAEGHLKAPPSLRPAGEILRLQGDRAVHLHGQVHDALTEGLGEFDGPDGVVARASTWIVTASAPRG